MIADLNIVLRRGNTGTEDHPSGVEVFYALRSGGVDTPVDLTAYAAQWRVWRSVRPGFAINKTSASGIITLGADGRIFIPITVADAAILPVGEQAHHELILTAPNGAVRTLFAGTVRQSGAPQ